MSVDSQISLNIKAEQVGVNAFGPISFSPKVSKVVTLADGAGAGQANKVFIGSFTLLTAAANSHDLAGSLTDAFNTVLTFTGIKALAIISADANTTTLTIGNGLTPFIGPFGAAAHTIDLKPGGIFLITEPGANGYSVTAATADILKITNSAGASATYTLVIIGE